MKPGLKGKLEVTKKMRDILKVMGKRVETAVVRGGLIIDAESAKQVPIDTGALSQSRYFKKRGSGINTTVEVGYTDGKAIWVHEDLSKNHGEFFNAAYRKQISEGKTHARRPTEKAKFLEDPVRENLPRLRDEVAKALKGL